LRPYNDLEIIQGIRAKDNQTLKYLYDSYFGMIYEMVSKNQGNEADARDIIQEAIILIYKKIRDGSFQLTTTFGSYFFSVCWNIWMRELRRRQTEIEYISEYLYFEESVNDQVVDEYEQQQRYLLYQEHFRKLGKDCQKLLKLFLKKRPLKEIARKMGHRSEKFTKKKKYLCKEQLVQSIKSDKRFRRYHRRQ